MRVGFLFAVSFFLFLKSSYLFVVQIDMVFKLFAILQKYDFSSKSQLICWLVRLRSCCLRYCKSTIFQANHNPICEYITYPGLFAILQKYDFSSKSQLLIRVYCKYSVVCDTAKVRFFKQITTVSSARTAWFLLFAILQKYDFSSKSQPTPLTRYLLWSCLRYCKSTIFQANHNLLIRWLIGWWVVCDTAKVRFFKQITTLVLLILRVLLLFAILQKYDFSSKSQQSYPDNVTIVGCLRYCKSTIFQANHNACYARCISIQLFAILQKYDFSSKSQLSPMMIDMYLSCLRYCKSTIFQANHNDGKCFLHDIRVVCDTAKVRFFKQITTISNRRCSQSMLFAILQKYDFSSKSQLKSDW